MVRGSGRATPAAMVLLVTTLLAAACSGTANAPVAGSSTAAGSSVPGGTTAPGTVPQKPVRYEAAPCPMPMPAADIDASVKVECGFLSVPENRLVANSATIRLAVARVRSRSPQPKPDPIVDLGGGPGFGSLDAVPSLTRSKIIDQRDYIVWDQRGIGFSTPNLDCPETNEAIWQVFSTTDPAAVEGKVIDDSERVCRARLHAQGVDLDGYTTIQNAADLADLREALGIDEWNLHGASYGSALAIEAVRSHPQGVRSVLLDSVAPPDVAFGAVARGQSALRAFDEAAKACAAQATCVQKYGDLSALIARAAAALDADPFRAEIDDPGTGQKRPIVITGQDLYAGLFNAMYQPRLIKAVPLVMQQIANGERGIIATLAAQSIPFAAGAAEGMANAVDCADRQRVLDRDALEPFAAAHPELGALLYVKAMENQCAIWDVHDVPAVSNQLLGPDTRVPIMVAAGRFDPITPPDGSRRVADALGVPLLLFPDAGHGAIGPSQCSVDIWSAFLDHPATAPDATCIGGLETITFG